ncbi:tRNA-specific 2-thiouridylase MnmA [Desulfosarcina ovata subsp. sediminis]|uniref:tRNA-specific 2-thiouridylase MnmA n=1 Tax=Desulfosarcina ovata subsp. sediminis TaxID=885957 RepID=A0A5K7ZGY0_9BACT|nr:tRNA 2-thiouridine(34) synthase MnmA [Desulfosarcina ovata]BBO81362.1 tRNA-specific 2-thiouridylase MnmA [Desulfosarcina ovata subsp. sediminis]
MTDRIAIAVSGGVDSLVCAHLLKQQRCDLLGFHFLTGYEKPEDWMARRIVALFASLGIPVAIVDLGAAFKKQVVDYFSDAYANGLTPNPCLVCNPLIKFGVLFEEAEKRGASRLATGHYAQVTSDPNGVYRLYKGVDPAKDQSYFLARLNQAQLARAVFPLGTWTKAEVMALADQKGLQPVTCRESQDVCFIQDGDYAQFLTTQAGIRPQPGDIVDTAGRRVGRHNGLHRYTIGQRRGIDCPASQAYYVVRIDIRQNRLVVGFKDELTTDRCRVRDMNWIHDTPSAPLAVQTRIRYRHRAVPAAVTPVGRDKAWVRFDVPQAAVTPGQGAVFYRGDEVIGGGWISDS